MTEPAVFTRILVPLDGTRLSEHALAFAAALSNAETTTTLLHVDEPEGATGAVVEAVVEAQDGAVPIDDEDQTKALNAVAERWRSVFKGAVEAGVAFGDPKTEILRAAGETNADLIVAATRARGAIGRWAFGSVADDLARSTTVPMLVARAKDEAIEPAPAMIDRILFPFDGSATAATALPLAIELAKRIGIPALVISAYDPGPAGPIVTGVEPSYPVAAYTEIQDELEALATEAAAKAQAEFAAAGVSAMSAVHLGPAALAIEDSATEGDLIVMTSHGRGGLKRAILGSVAERLIRDAKAPTLLVPTRPSGEPAQS
jgi:nucleotide-binding universal stress UspA family protein